MQEQNETATVVQFYSFASYFTAKAVYFATFFLGFGLGWGVILLAQTIIWASYPEENGKFLEPNFSQPQWFQGFRPACEKMGPFSNSIG